VAGSSGGTGPRTSIRSCAGGLVVDVHARYCFEREAVRMTGAPLPETLTLDDGSRAAFYMTERYVALCSDVADRSVIPTEFVRRGQWSQSLT
jgi:hypothetical protein